MYRVFVLAASTLLLSSVGCGNGNDHPKYTARKPEVNSIYPGTGPIKAVCTTGMVADLVRNVGKDWVKVEQIFGPDVDPHVFKPTTVEINQLQNADVIFFNGLHLEGKMGEVLERLGQTIPSFPVAEYLDAARILHDEDRAHDPHVWFDVDLWRQAAGIVGEVLARFDPPHAEEYRANAQKYQAALEDLDRRTLQQMGSLPPKQAVLITSHDAFRYFGKRYGITVRGIQGISTESEASLRDIEDLVQFIVARQVKAVFVETSVNPRAMRALIEGCKARSHPLAEGGELFSDAMGQPGTHEGTYVGMIEHNVKTIVNALK